MNLRHITKTFSLVGFTSVIVAASTLSAQAQEVQKTVSARTTANSAANTLVTDKNVSNKAADLLVQTPTNQTPTNQTPTNQTPTNQTPTNQTPTNQTPTNQTPIQPEQQTPIYPTQPQQQTPSSPTVPTSPSQTPDPAQESAPVQEQTPSTLSPGRPTRGGSSYIGVGGNIGLGGDTTLSEGAFAVYSKIGLTNNFSFRPAGLFGDNTVVLLPLTVDFPIESVTSSGVQQINVAPYIGAGAVISTGNNDDVGFLLTGGVDVPISSQFTANAGVNVGFIDDTEVGLQLGIGYNFR
jgi:hypothetical protein